MLSPSIQDFVIVTSNPVKRSEINRITSGKIRVVEGDDLDEVLGTPDEVITYKALAAGEGNMVEDAIVVIDDIPHVDVRFKLKELRDGLYPEGTSIRWEVRLGVLFRGVVYAYIGVTDGTICKMTEEGYGVDPIFLVDGVDQNMASLEKAGKKDDYSARSRALKEVLTGNPYLGVKANTINPWLGQYQGN